MKKKIVLEALFQRSKEIYPSKKDNKDLIRLIADNDESFENLVFELGCSVLAKKATNKQLKDIARGI